MKRFFSLKSIVFWVFRDDFIILFYAIIGILFLKMFRTEFKNFTSTFRWFFAGFSLCFLTILLDMLSHKGRILSLLVKDADKIAFMHNWFKTIEEIPKILAEGAFIIAFYYCFRIATRPAWERKKERTSSKIDTHCSPSLNK